MDCCNPNPYCNYREMIEFDPKHLDIILSRINKRSYKRLTIVEKKFLFKYSLTLKYGESTSARYRDYRQFSVQ